MYLRHISCTFEHRTHAPRVRNVDASCSPHAKRNRRSPRPQVPWEEIRLELPSEADSEVMPRLQALAERCRTFEQRLDRVSNEAGAAVQESVAAASVRHPLRWISPERSPRALRNVGLTRLPDLFSHSHQAQSSAQAPRDSVQLPPNVRSLMRTATIKAAEPSQLNPASAIANDFMARLKVGLAGTSGGGGGSSGGGGAGAGAAASSRSQATTPRSDISAALREVAARASTSGQAGGAGSGVGGTTSLSTTPRSGKGSDISARLKEIAARTSNTGSASGAAAGKPPLSPSSASATVAAFKAAAAASPRGSAAGSLRTSSTGGPTSPAALKAAELFAKYGARPKLSPSARGGSTSSNALIIVVCAFITSAQRRPGTPLAGTIDRLLSP